MKTLYAVSALAGCLSIALVTAHAADPFKLADGPIVKPAPKTPVVQPVNPVNPAIREATQPVLKAPITKTPVGPCPDLAAQAIDFRLVTRKTQFEGMVEIVGIVKNISTAAYESRPGQQSALLYEGTRLVKQQNFQNLMPGQELRLSYTRHWNSSSPAEGEFAPTYKLWLSFDPDIRLDGNPKNDDCRATNDRRERSGADINALFRR